MANAITKPIGRKLKCKQCGYEWHSRLEGRDPPMCPNTKCPRRFYWQEDPRKLNPHDKR
jgi:hypothetical protein